MISQSNEDESRRAKYFDVTASPLWKRLSWRMYERYGAKIYGKYGFVDAFNPKTGWVDTDVIGINAGIILLSAENMRTGNVWRWFMQNREIPLALNRVGLLKYGKEVRNAQNQSKRHHNELRTAGLR